MSNYWAEALETAPREVLEQKQLGDLKEIVQFAYGHAPYYRRSFGCGSFEVTRTPGLLGSV